jgi:hypothetical protein
MALARRLALLALLPLTLVCTRASHSEPITCASGAPRETAAITGVLRFLHTIGAVPLEFHPWAASRPHSGVVEIEEASTGESVRLNVGRNGRFGVEASPGRYRVVGYVPGVHEQDDSSLPVIRSHRTLSAGAGECQQVGLLIYDWLP